MPSWPQITFEGNPPTEARRAASEAMKSTKEKVVTTLRWEAAGWRVVQASCWPPEDRSITGRATQRAMPPQPCVPFVQQSLRFAGLPVIE